MTSNLRIKTITFDDRNRSALNYGSFWFLDQGTWNATNTKETGTLSSSNDPNANVTFDFPVPAIAFRYYGMRRSRGGLYGICIDCDSLDEPRFQNVDALNATDDGLNPPVVLFSKAFDTPAKHVIILRNQNDTRIVPGGNSQITIDRFELDVIDDSPASDIPQSPSPSPATDSGNTKPPIGAIVGGTVGGLILAVILIAIVFICRRRRRNHSRRLVSVHGDHEASLSTIVPYLQTRPSLSKEKQSRTSFSLTSDSANSSRSSLSTTTDSYPRLDSEEIESEAGTTPIEDEGSTLPPLYAEIFQGGGVSNRPPSGQAPDNTASVVRNTSKRQV
ncbi:hypothetical protein PM082_003603 [Marasmius tenuissimus]|nr:hypothetical protein PM082_003603 [Marasmius tenuissimus]